MRPGAAFGRYLGYYALAMIGGAAFFSLQYLPGVHGKEMVGSSVLFFLYFAIQFTYWHTGRKQEHEIAARLPDRAPESARTPNLKLLGGWYLASTAIALPGGAAIAVTMFFVLPEARTYAWSWLALLVLSAICTAVILTGILNGPAVAEDSASLAIDDLLRARDAYGVAPPFVALPLLLDFMEGRQPAAFTPWMIAYTVLSVGTLLIAVLRLRLRKLPPGYYGIPATPLDA
jgi:hypothetical protein